MGWALYQLGPTALLGLVITLLAVSSISKRFGSHKLVLRGYRIDFEPMAEGSDINGLTLSQPVQDLLQGDAKYGVIIGRPAGLINYMREGMGLSRRFEFAISKRQTALRMASFTSHALQCSKLDGLNSITVAQKRLNPLILFIQFLVTAAIANFIWISLMGGGDISELLTLLIFAGFVYYFVICKVTFVAFSEGGAETMKFAIYPAFLERIFGGGGLDMPLDDANRLVQIFRVLKER